MRSSKKEKNEKIVDQQDQVTKPQKKQKNKKKKKDHQQQVQQKGDYITTKASPSSNNQAPLTTKPQPFKLTTTTHTIQQQLSTLPYDGLLTPNQRTCLLINSHLQQITINLYQTMIMKSSLIQTAISEAKRSQLTPKEYFAIDYTNKLLLIKKLLLLSGANKFRRFVEMIDGEVSRVEKLILLSLDNVNIFGEVLIDLKKNNVQWEISNC